MTTNEMIYKTISTKLTRTPIYKSVLEDLGYEVYDSTWSSYNYWAVRNKKTGKTILFSNGYDNKRRLYDNATPIKANDYKKVDYVGYLNKNKPTINHPYFEEISGKYSMLRVTIRQSKSMIKAYERWINEKQEKLDEIIEDIRQYNESKANYQKGLDKAREEVRKLRRY